MKRFTILKNRFSIQVRSTEQLINEMSQMHAPPNDLDIRNGSVYARTTIGRGTKYGPFTGKLTNEPVDQRFAWEVSDFFFFLKI